MEIRYEKKEPKKVAICTLNKGEAFMFNEVPYVRVGGDEIPFNSLGTYGVSIKQGCMKKFDSDAKVIPVEASVTIKYDEEA